MWTGIYISLGIAILAVVLLYRDYCSRDARQRAYDDWLEQKGTDNERVRRSRSENNFTGA